MVGLQFWICVALAFFVGGFFGSLTMAVVAVGKDSNFWPPGPDEYVDLEHSVPIAPAGIIERVLDDTGEATARSSEPAVRRPR